jgi:hypothetical protein
LNADFDTAGVHFLVEFQLSSNRGLDSEILGGLDDVLALFGNGLGPIARLLLEIGFLCAILGFESFDSKFFCLWSDSRSVLSVFDGIRDSKASGEL